MELLLRVWREACRHIEIDQSIERIAQQLTGHIPADVVLVRRLDATRAILETAATGFCVGGTTSTALAARTECTARQLTDLLRWIRAGDVMRSRVGSADSLAAVLLPAG